MSRGSANSIENKVVVIWTERPSDPQSLSELSAGESLFVWGYEIWLVRLTS